MIPHFEEMSQREKILYFSGVFLAIIVSIAVWAWLLQPWFTYPLQMVAYTAGVIVLLYLKKVGVMMIISVVRGEPEQQRAAPTTQPLKSAPSTQPLEESARQQNTKPLFLAVLEEWVEQHPGVMPVILTQDEHKGLASRPTMQQLIDARAEHVKVTALLQSMVMALQTLDNSAFEQAADYLKAHDIPIQPILGGEAH